MDAGEYVPDEVTNLMVRNRIDEPDAEPGFLLDGYPRTLAAGRGARRDDQVHRSRARRRRRPHRRPARSSSQRLLQRAETEGRADDTEDVIRRRQEVYAEQTEPLIEVYRDRNLLIEVDGMGEVDEVTERIFAALDARPRELTARGRHDGFRVTAGRDQDARADREDAGRRAAGRRDPRAAALARCAPAITTGELDAIAEEQHPRPAAAIPSFLGYGAPAVPRPRSAPRSTTRSSTASRATGCSQDGDVISIDCGAIVDGWHGDAAITVAVGEVPRRRARADAGHRGVDVGRLRRGPARRPGHRHLRTPSSPTSARSRTRRAAATASSRTTPATASARRCTSRRTCPTTAAPGGGRSSSAGWPSRSSRW